MTKEEPLLVKLASGWGWGRWHGHTDVSLSCVVARALDRDISEPQWDAEDTKLGRQLDDIEFEAISAADAGVANDYHREIILGLAKHMGVEE